MAKCQGTSGNDRGCQGMSGSSCLLSVFVYSLAKRKRLEGGGATGEFTGKFAGNTELRLLVCSQKLS